MIAREIDPATGGHQRTGVRRMAESEVRRARQHHFRELTVADRLGCLLNQPTPALFAWTMGFALLMQREFSRGMMGAERRQTGPRPLGVLCQRSLAPQIQPQGGPASFTSPFQTRQKQRAACRFKGINATHADVITRQRSKKGIRLRQRGERAHGVQRGNLFLAAALLPVKLWPDRLTVQPGERVKGIIQRESCFKDSHAGQRGKIVCQKR